METKKGTSLASGTVQTYFLPWNTI